MLTMLVVYQIINILIITIMNRMNLPILGLLPNEGVVEAVAMVKVDPGRRIGTIKQMDLLMIEIIEINIIKEDREEGKVVGPIGVTVVLPLPKHNKMLHYKVSTMININGIITTRMVVHKNIKMTDQHMRLDK